VLNKLPIEMGIKTGTAEVEGQNSDGVDYDSYAWMIGFAPYENPEIAISIVITQGYNSHNVAPIMRDIVAKYFDINAESIDNISNRDMINKQIYQNTGTESDNQTITNNQNQTEQETNQDFVDDGE